MYVCLWWIGDGEYPPIIKCWQQVPYHTDKTLCVHALYVYIPYVNKGFV